MGGDKNYFDSKYVTELSPEDFVGTRTWSLKNQTCAIVLFYAPWCPYCKNMKSVWNELGKTAAFFNVYAFNCEKYKEYMNRIKEDMPELVNSYPTMLIYKQGEPVERVGEAQDQRNVGYFINTCMRACRES